LIELEPILERVASGDPVGAAYRLTQEAGPEAPGKLFYDAGSMALSRREELGEDALRFARLAFAEAVERDPSLAEAHHDLATTMRELGMAEDAIAHYQRALELAPDDVDALIGLGAAQCDAGKLDEAIKTLERASESHPDSGRAYANLGVALEAAGRDEKAAAAYAKAVARFDAQLGEADDDEVAADVAARRRWARIQHAELLERLERWPQAIVEFRRLYEEEQAIAEAEEAAAEAEAEEAKAVADAEAEEAPPPSNLTTDVPAAPPDDAEGETLLEDREFADAVEELAEDGDEDDLLEDDGDEDEAGRSGLERLFARLVMIRRVDLAFLVLDDLGGELADARTRATYTIYDPGDGTQTIMVEQWDGGDRQRLDP
jgi:tetratricopeptide (TPR) repeat protein